MRQGLVLLLCVAVSVATPRLALAICGDGVKQANEFCDNSAPGGDGFCPNRCIDPPAIGACTCATLSGDFRKFALISDVLIRIGKDASVTSGSVAVQHEDGALYLASGGFIPSAEQAIADRCRLQAGSSLGLLFCNTDLIQDGASVQGGGPFGFTPPRNFTNLPTFSSSQPAPTAVDVATRSVRFLEPGAYGIVIVQPDGILVLQGLDPFSGVGEYDLRALKVTGGGMLIANNPAIVRIAESFKVTGDSFVGPNPANAGQPGDLQISVGGRAAKLGRGALVNAHVFAPTGRISVGRGTNAIGRLVANKIVLQKSSRVELAGGCGDGMKGPTETCDTSALGGDIVCPGKCIPGDPQGLGRIQFGSPGQCSCQCTTDAECDDDNLCNGVETCNGNHCVPGDPPSCDDNNPCTLDCDPEIGCATTPLPDLTSCDDGDKCTKSDKCMSGVCEAGEPRSCNDANDCTLDSCDPEEGCLHTALPTGLACEDGNACTVGDACIRGTCVTGAPRSCNDLNPCTVDACNVIDGCTHSDVGNGTSCAGPSPCTIADVCVDGACTSGVGTICNDSNPCTVDTCSLEGPINQQVASCDHTPSPNFTQCGPNGLVCFNGVCQ